MKYRISPEARAPSAEWWGEGKKRYQPFYEMTAANLATLGLEQAALEAGRKMGWSGWRGIPLTEKAIDKKVRQILKRPDTMEKLGLAYETATGVSAGALMRKAQAWIDGEIEHDGEKLPPSREMLTKVLDVTLPKAPKQVQIDQRMQIQRIGALSNTSGPPALRARVLNPSPNPALPKPDPGQADA